MEKSETGRLASGAPGAKAYWAPGAKSAVGTALSDDSNVWFTLGHGIFNEVYWPRVDSPSIRDMGFIVTDGASFFSEEVTSAESDVRWHSPGVPAFHMTNKAERYKVEKLIVADPSRDAVVQHTKFSADNLKLFIRLAPHLGNRGAGNTARIIRAGQQIYLVAEREEFALALACSSGFIEASAGYIGSSDGREDLVANHKLTRIYDTAEDGNVALVAEIDLSKSDEFTLALGFGKDINSAIEVATASLADGYQKAEKVYAQQWRSWLEAQHQTDLLDFAKNSLAVLKCHESKNPGGGLIAGLASPWGYAMSDDNPIGYHIVWTRDMVQTAGGLLAAGAYGEIRKIIGYLQGTQREDGHWPQNMWLDGTPYWQGVQMDETALPILLVNLARREDAIDDNDVIDYWPMVKKAAGYLVRNGPVTQQDRWEEDPGYTPFTMSAEIAALLAAADFAEQNGEPELAKYLRETADNWHDGLDRWMFATGTDWAKENGVDGYYERIATVDKSIVARFQNTVHVKNVPPEDAHLHAAHLISPDALAFTRFGLRKADDPRMVSTVKLIDQLLKIETPYGPTWHRYNDDGYGENADGSAFDSTGIGRGWPLLTGERAHYELARGYTDLADKLRIAMEKFASESGLLPEQVWDSEAIPAHELTLGRPAGSAMPLAWAHAEYLKLVRSLKDGRIFDMPHQTEERYLKNETTTDLRSWRFNHKIRAVEPGKILRVETLTPAKIHWSGDNWQTSHDNETSDSGLGLYYADLATAELPAGAEIRFTFYWQHAEKWEGSDYVVAVSDL